MEGDVALLIPGSPFRAPVMDALGRNGVEQLFRPDHGLDALCGKVIVDAGNVRRVDILSGFILAAGANADRIVFVVANVNDLGLKYLYDFIQKLEYQPVGIRMIGACLLYTSRCV